MKNLNGWLVWLLLCAVLMASTVCISAAVIVHNPAHYNGDSLRMAVLLVAGLELLFTLIGMLIDIFEIR